VNFKSLQPIEKLCAFAHFATYVAFTNCASRTLTNEERNNENKEKCNEEADVRSSIVIC